MPENYLQNQGNPDENWVYAREIFEKLQEMGRVSSKARFRDWVKTLAIDEKCLLRKSSPANLRGFGDLLEIFISQKEAKKLLLQKSPEIAEKTIAFTEKAGAFLADDDAILARAFEILSKKVKELEPKALLMEAREANRANLKGIRDTFWALKAELGNEFFDGEREFIANLISNEILYRNRLKDLRPYADFAEFFELKPVAFKNDPSREHLQLFVNQKGFHWLFKMFSSKKGGSK